MYSGIFVNHSLFLSDFNETRIFLIFFLKILKYEFSRKPI